MICSCSPQSSRRAARRAVGVGFAAVSLAALLAVLAASSGMAEAEESISLRRGGVVMRQGPGNFHPVIEVLDVGAQLQVVERQAAWSQVRLEGGGEGWVATAALDAEAAEETGAETMPKPSAAVPTRVGAVTLTAMIKGFSAKVGVQVDPDEALEPVAGLTPDSVVSFRGGFAPVEFDAPVAAREAGLVMMPELLAMAPVLAAEAVAEWGGESPQLGRYGTLVLLWIAERAGAGGLAPYCLVTASGTSAVSLPGGWVIVGGELFALLQDESELAGVLGHELCHCIFNHGRKAMEREAWRLGVEGTFAELEAETETATAGELELEEFAGEVRRMMWRRWSLGDELQADSASTVWLARCGYDVEGLLRVLQRMRETFAGPLTGRGGITIAWLNSSGELDARIKRLEKLVQRVKRKCRGGERFTARFQLQAGR